MRDNKPLAHIIIGFIGSGKTTFARKLEEETGAIRFTKDEWMVRLFGNTPPKDKFEEYDIDRYWKFFRPPDKDEEFTLVNQAYSNIE